MLAQGRQRLLLAVLLVHAGEAVRADALVEALWDGEPPASALRSLHNLVSGLRKALDDGALVTEGRSYRLRVDSLDADQFETLAAAGRFHEALALWRGPALGDLAGEPALRAAAARLQERRLTVLEDRIDADLDAGRHAELVAELDSLVAEHPLRERLRAQQMLALYRSGRQADALHAYSDARRHLVSELGLEPGPALRELERAILAHDPALGAPAGVPAGPRRRATRALPTDSRRRRAAWGLPTGWRRHAASPPPGDTDAAPPPPTTPHAAPPPPTTPHAASAPPTTPHAASAPPTTPHAASAPPTGRRRRRRVVGAFAAVGVAAVAVAVVASGDPPAPPPASRAAAATATDVVAAIDPRTNRMVATVGVGATPVVVAVGEGAVWSLSGDDLTLTRVDLGTRAARTFATGGAPVDLATGGGALWVSQARRGPRRGPAYDEVVTPASVARLDPASGGVRATQSLPQPARAVYRVPPGDLVAYGSLAAWVISRPSWLHRIDAVTGERRTLRSARATRVATGDGQVWIVDTRGELVRLDPRDGRPLARIPVTAGWITALAVGGGAVWLTDAAAGTLWRVDPITRVSRTIDVGEGVDSLAFGAGAAWVGNSQGATVTRVDAATNRVSATIAAGGTPRALAVGGGRVWVGISNVAPAPAASAASGVRALSAPPCGPVQRGRGGADLLIASDEPLTGQQNSTVPMAAAVGYVLRTHGYRAGRFRVGFQSCDDATAYYGTWDPAKCAANGSAYAANAAVIGVVGPLNSGCASALLKTLEPASVSLISPTNSALSLVRDEHHRGYARMIASDDYVAAAGALAAKRLGTRVFFLEDGEFNAGNGIRGWFRHAAKAIGLRIAGRAAYSVEASDYRRLAERVRASGADVVFLNAGGASNLKRLLEDLRTALGPSVAYVGGPDMFPTSRLLDSTGPAALGIHGVSPMLPVEQLDSKFVRGFAATQPRGDVSSLAVYAAAATEVLLDAIARSDGTRASVARELTKTRLADSVLGPLAFADNGEPAVARVALARVERAASDPSDIYSLAGTASETVFTVPRSLIE